MPLLSASNVTNGTAGWAGVGGTPLVTGLGGNDRGTGAIDMQSARALDTQVASGNYSCIPGGKNNTASGDYSFCFGYNASAIGNHSIAMGNGAYAGSLASIAIGWGAYVGPNSAHSIALGLGTVDYSSPYSIAVQGGRVWNTAPSSVAIGGTSANARAPYSLVVGSNNQVTAVATYGVSIGFGGNASGQPHTCAIGFTNPTATARGAVCISGESSDAGGYYCVVINSTNNACDGDYAAMLGGWNVDTPVTGAYSVVAAGRVARADLPAAITLSGGQSGIGQTQLYLVHLDAVTDATTTTANMQSVSSELTLPTTGLFNVFGRIVAHNVTSNTASYWPISVLVKSIAGALTIIASTPVAGVATAATADNDARALTVTVSAVGTALRFAVASSDDDFRWSGTFTVARATS